MQRLVHRLHELLQRHGRAVRRRIPTVHIENESLQSGLVDGVFEQEHQVRELRGVRRSLVPDPGDRKSTRLNSSHVKISYAVFCLKKKNIMINKSLKEFKMEKR